LSEYPKSADPNAQSSDASVLQYVVDNIPYLIFWKDRNSRYLGCNKNFAALDGQSDPKHMLGRTDADMLWRDQAEAYRAGDLATMAAGEPILNKEEVSPDGKGGEMVILTSKVPLRDQRGEVSGLLGIIVDITERKRLELDLQKARDEAEQAVREKSDFIANVTHELRTPLTLILGPVVDALADPDLPLATRRLLDRVQRNAFRLYNLVNDVLDLSKAEAGQTRARPEQTDVVAALGSLLEDMRPLADVRKLKLEFETALAELPAAIDLKLLERIVLNLVGNGLKFTAPGGYVRVTLALEAGGFRLDVSDNGAGIDAATKARLFQKFVQADASATRKHEGTGLGLALVKHFTGVLGGSLHVESELGRGSTFSVHLPLSAAGDTAVSADENEVVEHGLGSRGFQRQVALTAPAPLAAVRPSDSTPPQARVLVAEDNADLRSYILETLSSDFSVVGVQNGAEAWEALQSQRFDLVISDVMMPVLDGIRLTRKIKLHDGLNAIPVILLSARGGAEAATSGLDAGADDYLAKPFGANELRARARAAYRTKHLQEQLREQSRAAGVAEVATGIVHNVGNVLNSVGISADLLHRTVNDSAVGLLERLSALLSEHASSDSELLEFLTREPSGKGFAVSLQLVTERLLKEHEEQRVESESILECVGHVRDIVASQQGLTRGFVAREATDVNAILDKAVLLSTSLLRGASIQVERDYQQLPMLWLDPHILLQTMINLLNNARQALAQNPVNDRRVLLHTRLVGEQIEILVGDNGEGIPSKNLGRIFQQGFTTKAHGQGFGLHMSAVNLRVVGGSIRAHSDGPGLGATFTVALPIETQSRAAE
jgi:PAS domain S-box-containing protein